MSKLIDFIISITLISLCLANKDICSNFEKSNDCVCDDSDGFCYFICENNLRITILRKSVEFVCSVPISEDSFVKFDKEMDTVVYNNCKSEKGLFEILSMMNITSVKHLNVTVSTLETELNEKYFENISKFSLQSLNFQQRIASFPVFHPINTLKSFIWRFRAKEVIPNTVFENFPELEILFISMIFTKDIGTGWFVVLSIFFIHFRKLF